MDPKKMRNLKREEKLEVIKSFLEILKNIQINSKPLVRGATQKTIMLNPDISIEEIQKTLNVKDQTKSDFIRQLYVRSGDRILKQLYPDQNILNIPVMSFEQHGESIQLNY